MLTSLRELARRRSLWIGFGATLVPLLLILGLQAMWLKRLEQTSALAARAGLGRFLDAVSTEVLYYYGPVAEQVLDLAPSVVADPDAERLAAYFRRKTIAGVRRYFIVRFSADENEAGTILFFDAARGTMLAAEPSEETRAVTLASAPWRLMRAKAIELASARLVVEEGDPDNRIVLKPVLDASSHVVGAAGMILDVDYFARRLLPSAVREVLPRFFPGGGGRILVTARDETGRARFTTGPPPARDRSDSSRSFSFVFTDWRIEVQDTGPSPEAWARAGFLSNMALSALAALLLAGGLALALVSAAREVRLSRMKSDFVSNVSHELRTPVASIRVFGELLRAGRAGTAEKVREYGGYIEAESRRLTQLINNLLDFSRIESGRKTYSLREGDVREVLESTLRLFDVPLRQGGFTLEYRAAAGPVPRARLDPDALAQAFHNLLDNAVHYSGESRWIGVALETRGGGILVSVADRGIGIPKDEQERIFDRFHRVGTGLVHDVRGSGLGLAIVRHIVEAHGGSVSVKSEIGRGSTFEIWIPAAGGDAQ